jgi:hypothetical protein
MLQINDQKLQALIEAWNENRLATAPDNMKATIKQLYNPELADGKKYIKLNQSPRSGHFMIDKATEIVYSIKGFGVPNLKKPRGTVEFLTRFIKECTAKGVEYTHTYWYDLHPTE